MSEEIDINNLQNEFNENTTLEFIERNDFFKTMEEYLICPLCHNLYNNPYMCLKCQNSVCKKCLDEYNENLNYTSNNKNKCSFNCEEPIFKPDKYKINILDKLVFQCMKGCGKSFKYSNLKAHLSSCKGDKKVQLVKRINTEEAREIKDQGKNIPSKKIILIGNSSVGKSSVLSTFIEEHSNLIHIATVGFGFEAVTYQLSDGSVMNFQIWDTAGQELYFSLTDSYLRNADGCILMYDITVKNTFPDEQSYFITKLKECYPNKFPPTILVGNKSDLEMRREVPKIDAIHLSQKLGFLFLESSAKTNENIANVFEVLFETVNYEHKILMSNANIDYNELLTPRGISLRNKEKKEGYQLCGWVNELFKYGK